MLSFDDADGVKHLVGRYWTPLEALDARSQAEQELFKQWLKAGHLIGIDGPVIRLDFVAREIVKLSRQYKIKRIHYDRYYVADLKLALNDVGGSDIELVETRPGLQGLRAMRLKLHRGCGKRQAAPWGTPGVDRRSDGRRRGVGPYRRPES